MKKLSFTKMHSLGNDFVIINAHELPVALSALPITQLADRNRGIGFDQLLVVTPKQKVEEFFCQIFNADGSEAEQCGNGLRCVARYVRENKLCDDASLNISTVAGSYPINIKDFDRITVDMGMPVLAAKPLSLKTKYAANPLQVSVLNIGNPHAIVNLADVVASDAKRLADEIAQQSYFSKGVNVGFVEVMKPGHLRLRTFERGVGETLACGSNACAAAVVGIQNKWVQSPVKVEFLYGDLDIAWRGGNEHVFMTGNASRVFSGDVCVE